MFDGCSILVTGGTGSFGQAFVRHLLENHSPGRIVIFSRDEMKQWDMNQKFGLDERLRFFIGDVREKERLMRAMSGIDYVIHAAALKIVPTAEYNPFECVKTNIIGAMNVIDAALDSHVKKVVALSTDKASSPVNMYGASKLASDKMFISSNSYSGGRGTAFSVVRYGNVMGSRGSVLPLFYKLKDLGKIPITDERMTRFMITLQQGVQFVCLALEKMVGGEIFIKKIPSMNILDIAEAIAPNVPIELVGIRPGEKIHEQMIGEEDAPFTREYDEYFKILPNIDTTLYQSKRWSGGKAVATRFVYDSGTNKQLLSVRELQAWIRENEQTLKQEL